MKQLSIFDFGVKDTDEQEHINVLVERPNGTTFWQDVALQDNETPYKAAKRYQKQLGDPYKWATVRGKRIRYLKKDAYLVIRYEVTQREGVK